ncbi:FecR domain-containing protein [Sphingomonas sp. OTU376]|uniref:FecR domain-containing protein n=1 Tax=Sphingomonas sp. OTU376 TaxID=3043863 RepID=UPI00313DA199
MILDTPPPVTRPAPHANAIAYVIRRGDTADQLSRKYLVEGRDWRALLKLARVQNPRRLPTGRQLLIPRSWLRYRIEPARLASYRGKVAITANGREASAVIGASIDEGMFIATAANSFATLILADQSRIVLPSQSRVRVRELRRILLTNAIDYRLEITSGRLETKVQPLEGPSGRYRIETPVSMTAVRGTEFRVSFAAGTAITEVLSGHVLVTDSDGQTRALALDPGIGAARDGDGAVRTEPLLPAPALEDPGAVQLDDNVAFRAAPTPGAARYRLVIASDAGFIDNNVEQISEDGRFTFTDIPNGNQFARISAIAPSGVEGFAQSYGFKRRLASLHASVDMADDGYRFRWWGSGNGTRRYRFQLLSDTPEAPPIVDRVGLEQDSLTLHRLTPGVYHWRVGLLQIETDDTVETWTNPEKLTIAGPSARRKADR